MAYFLSQIVVLVHFLFILYVIFGGMLSYRWRRNNWVHLPVFVYGVLVELYAWVCPLTPLENWLTRMAGREGYEAGFIEEYLVPMIYPSSFDLDLQLKLATAVIVINLLIYFPIIRSWYVKRKGG